MLHLTRNEEYSVSLSPNTKSLLSLLILDKVWGLSWSVIFYLSFPCSLYFILYPCFHLILHFSERRLSTLWSVRVCSYHLNLLQPFLNSFWWQGMDLKLAANGLQDRHPLNSLSSLFISSLLRAVGKSFSDVSFAPLHTALWSKQTLFEKYICIYCSQKGSGSWKALGVFKNCQKGSGIPQLYWESTVGGSH